MALGFGILDNFLRRFRDEIEGLGNLNQTIGLLKSTASAIVGLSAPFKGAVHAAEVFNRSLLDSQIAFSVATQEIDAFGNSVENFADRLASSRKAFHKLEIDLEIETRTIVGLTSQRLANILSEVVQESSLIFGQYTEKSGSEITEVYKNLTANLGAAYSLLGSPKWQDAQETRALIMGRVTDPNAYVANKLNISRTEADEAKAAGTYIDLIIQKTQAYRVASTLASNTIENLVSNLEELQEEAGRAFGQPVLKRFTDLGAAFFDSLTSTKRNNIEDLKVETAKGVLSIDKDLEKNRERLQFSTSKEETNNIIKNISSLSKQRENIIEMSSQKLETLGEKDPKQLLNNIIKDDLSFDAREKIIKKEEKDYIDELTPFQSLTFIAQDLGDAFSNLLESLSSILTKIGSILNNLNFGELINGATTGFISGLFSTLEVFTDTLLSVLSIIDSITKAMGGLIDPILSIETGTVVGIIAGVLAAITALGTAMGGLSKGFMHLLLQVNRLAVSMSGANGAAATRGIYSAMDIGDSLRSESLRINRERRVAVGRRYRALESARQARGGSGNMISDFFGRWASWRGANRGADRARGSDGRTLDFFGRRDRLGAIGYRSANAVNVGGLGGIIAKMGIWLKTIGAIIAPLIPIILGVVAAVTVTILGLRAFNKLLSNLAAQDGPLGAIAEAARKFVNQIDLIGKYFDAQRKSLNKTQEKITVEVKAPLSEFQEMGGREGFFKKQYGTDSERKEVEDFQRKMYDTYKKINIITGGNDEELTKEGYSKEDIKNIKKLRKNKSEIEKINEEQKDISKIYTDLFKMEIGSEFETMESPYKGGFAEGLFSRLNVSQDYRSVESSAGKGPDLVIQDMENISEGFEMLNAQNLLGTASLGIYAETFKLASQNEILSVENRNKFLALYNQAIEKEKELTMRFLSAAEMLLKAKQQTGEISEAAAAEETARINVLKAKEELAVASKKAGVSKTLLEESTKKAKAEIDKIKSTSIKNIEIVGPLLTELESKSKSSQDITSTLMVSGLIEKALQNRLFTETGEERNKKTEYNKNFGSEAPNILGGLIPGGNGNNSINILKEYVRQVDNILSGEFFKATKKKKTSPNAAKRGRQAGDAKVIDYDYIIDNLSKGTSDLRIKEFVIANREALLNTEIISNTINDYNSKETIEAIKKFIESGEVDISPEVNKEQLVTSIKRAIEEVTKNNKYTISIRALLESNSLSLGIAELERKIKELSGQIIIEFDDNYATKKLKELRAEREKLGRKIISGQATPEEIDKARSLDRDLEKEETRINRQILNQKEKKIGGEINEIKGGSLSAKDREKVKESEEKINTVTDSLDKSREEEKVIKEEIERLRSNRELTDEQKKQLKKAEDKLNLNINRENQSKEKESKLAQEIAILEKKGNRPLTEAEKNKIEEAENNQNYLKEVKDKLEKNSKYLENTIKDLESKEQLDPEEEEKLSKARANLNRNKGVLKVTNDGIQKLQDEIDKTKGSKLSDWEKRQLENAKSQLENLQKNREEYNRESKKLEEEIRVIKNSGVSLEENEEKIKEAEERLKVLQNNTQKLSEEEAKLKSVIEASKGKANLTEEEEKKLKEAEDRLKVLQNTGKILDNRAKLIDEVIAKESQLNKLTEERTKIAAEADSEDKAKRLEENERAINTIKEEIEGLDKQLNINRFSILEEAEAKLKDNKELNELSGAELRARNAEVVSAQKLYEIEKLVTEEKKQQERLAISISRASLEVAKLQNKASGSFNPELFETEIGEARINEIREQLESARVNVVENNKRVEEAYRSIGSDNIKFTLQNIDQLGPETFKTEMENLTNRFFKDAEEALEFAQKSVNIGVNADRILKADSITQEVKDAYKFIYGKDIDPNIDLKSLQSLILNTKGGLTTDNKKAIDIGAIKSNLETNQITREEAIKGARSLGIKNISDDISKEKLIDTLIVEYGKSLESDELIKNLDAREQSLIKVQQLENSIKDAVKNQINALIQLANEEEKRINRLERINTLMDTMGTDDISQGEADFKNAALDFKEAYTNLQNTQLYKNPEKMFQLLGKTSGVTLADLQKLNNRGGLSEEDSNILAAVLESMKRLTEIAEQRIASVLEKRLKILELLNIASDMGLGPQAGLLPEERNVIRATTRLENSILQLNSTFELQKKEDKLLNKESLKEIDVTDNDTMDSLMNFFNSAKEALNSFTELSLRRIGDISQKLSQQISIIGSLQSAYQSISQASEIYNSIAGKMVSKQMDYLQRRLQELNQPNPEEEKIKQQIEAIRQKGAHRFGGNNFGEERKIAELERKLPNNNFERERIEYKIFQLKEKQIQLENLQAEIALRRQATENKIAQLKNKQARLELFSERAKIMAIEDPQRRAFELNINDQLLGINKLESGLLSAGGERIQSAIKLQKGLNEGKLEDARREYRASRMGDKSFTQSVTLEFDKSLEVLTNSLKFAKEESDNQDKVDREVDKLKNNLGSETSDSNLMDIINEAEKNREEVREKLLNSLPKDIFDKLSEETKRDINQDIKNIIVSVSEAIEGAGIDTNLEAIEKNTAAIAKKVSEGIFGNPNPSPSPSPENKPSTKPSSGAKPPSGGGAKPPQANPVYEGSSQLENIMMVTIEEVLKVGGRSIKEIPKEWIPNIGFGNLNGPGGTYNSSTNQIMIDNKHKEALLSGNLPEIELLVHEIRHWIQSHGLNRGNLGLDKLPDGDYKKHVINTGLKPKEKGGSGDTYKERDSYVFAGLFTEQILKNLPSNLFNQISRGMVIGSQIQPQPQQQQPLEEFLHVLDKVTGEKKVMNRKAYSAEVGRGGQLEVLKSVTSDSSTGYGDFVKNFVVYPGTPEWRELTTGRISKNILDPEYRENFLRNADSMSTEELIDLDRSINKTFRNPWAGSQTVPNRNRKEISELQKIVLDTGKSTEQIRNEIAELNREEGARRLNIVNNLERQGITISDRDKNIRKLDPQSLIEVESILTNKKTTQVEKVEAISSIFQRVNDGIENKRIERASTFGDGRQRAIENERAKKMGPETGIAIREGSEPWFNIMTNIIEKLIGSDYIRTDLRDKFRNNAQNYSVEELKFIESQLYRLTDTKSNISGRDENFQKNFIKDLLNGGFNGNNNLGEEKLRFDRELRSNLQLDVKPINNSLDELINTMPNIVDNIKQSFQKLPTVTGITSKDVATSINLSETLRSREEAKLAKEMFTGNKDNSGISIASRIDRESNFKYPVPLPQNQPVPNNNFQSSKAISTSTSTNTTTNTNNSVINKNNQQGPVKFESSNTDISRFISAMEKIKSGETIINVSPPEVKVNIPANVVVPETTLWVNNKNNPEIATVNNMNKNV